MGGDGTLGFPITLTAVLIAALAQSGCAADLDTAWRAYRSGAIDSATAGFKRAEAQCPRHPQAQLGLGFVALRQGAPMAARARFRAAVRLAPDATDAWYGLGLAYSRLDARGEAIDALRRALALAPGYADVEDALLGLGIDSGLTAPAARPPQPVVPARTTGERFEIQAGGRWQPFYLKGINLGVALPGRFPAEFPMDDSTYARWFGLIAAANANVVRVYTILPPAFYRALADWNARHVDRVLWLVQGVWTEPPPNNDYDAAAWKASFRGEMRRAVDVVHGRARLARRPGHAWGRYQGDVSANTLAFIIGREWEPATILAFNTRRPDRTRYAGRYLAVARGSPAETWMAEQCDYLLAYEWDNYHAARPIAYTNWPTLDPLHHVHEPTLAEEAELRRKAGLPPNPRLKEYDNDAVGLDAMVVQPTDANQAGYFAAFHAYPYYPDFIALDSAYAPNHYLGYLRDLQRHHAGRPVVIAEYGVPSSRGMAHFGPEQRHHGGHDEVAMAAIDTALTRDIRAAGMAGGILFAWMDEWFKHNWLVIDLELPAERTRLWHNVENPEQHYGLLAMYAGPPDRPEPAGDARRWTDLPQHARGSGLVLRAGADASYLYLALETGVGFDSASYVIGIDTYRADRGLYRLPGLNWRTTTGLEFALVIEDTGRADLRVVAHYNPFIGPRVGMGPTGLDRFYNLGAAIDSQPTSVAYDSLFVTTNRFRIARNGRTYPARGVNRGRLRYRADWFIDRAAGLLELRIPWNLLNVTDPSSRTVLARVQDPGPFATAETDGFRFVAAAVRRGTGHILTRLESTAPFAWAKWETPQWHERLKPAYAAMQSVWGEP